MNREQIIAFARGDRPVDVLLKNGKLINVLSGEIHDVSVAIQENTIVGFGDYEAQEVIDLNGRYIAPGLIDGHLHLESSMLAIPELARNIVPLGTTSVVADPHEIANVLGTEGVRYILDSSEGLPLNVFIMFPSCVPATPFETSGADLSAADMLPFKDHPRILGLAEMMNFPGLVGGDPGVLEKLDVFADKVLDGHAPGLSGKGLCAYTAAGIGSDHECTTLDEAREKLRCGMHILMREGSAAKNLDALLPLINAFNSRKFSLVTDDMDPRDITENGHINRLVKRVMDKGVDPVRAFQMTSINTAAYFGLKRLGAVAPGYRADMVILDDLDSMKIDRVYKDGKLVAQSGAMVVEPSATAPETVTGSMSVDWSRIPDFTIKAEGTKANIIEVLEGQIVTSRRVEEAPVSNGHVTADTERDILKIAVIERHKGTGAHAIGLIRGFGLKRGAIAGSVAHDAHNIIVIGADDASMMTAARTIADMGGGLTVVDNGAPKAKLPLPIAGLMSDQPIERVKSDLTAVMDAAKDLGCGLEAPFGTLSFMALSPIPELKITDQGLFDSLNFKFVPLFED